MIKIVRKRGGRYYNFQPGMKVPLGWRLQDENGNEFADEEALNKFNEPKKKAPSKPRAARKAKE